MAKKKTAAKRSFSHQLRVRMEKDQAERKKKADEIIEACKKVAELQSEK